MKRLLSLLAFFAFALSLNAQTTLYQDDFEAYTANATLTSQNPAWVIWPGGTSGIISTAFANSGTKSVKVSGTNDLIYGFGNKISGSYQIDFHYYIPTGFGGYFNFQRHQSPGIEWVMEAYFGNNGAGYLDAGGPNAATFTFPMNTWFHIKNVIDLDADLAKFYINDNLIHQWQWSLTTAGAVSPAGAQLGGINIYAGAPTGQTSTYYMDDFRWLELATGNNPQITLNPMQFQKNLVAGQSVTDNLNVSNTGSAPLSYNFEVNYNFAKSNAILETPAFSGTAVKNLAASLVADPNTNTATEPDPTEEVYLNYDGPNFTGIGLNNPNQWEVAAKFTNNLTVPHAGMMLTKVDVYINHVENCTFKLRIYGEGSAVEPGAMLVEQSFTPVMPEWHTITLTTPIVVTGEELWVGYWIDQTLASIYPAGADAGPAHPHGDYIKTGAGWSHISPTLNYNWNIRARLEGTAGGGWLSLNPATGSLAPAQNTNHVVTFNASAMSQGSYNAIIKAKSNDPDNPVKTIPVTINVTGSATQPSITLNPTSLSETLPPGQSSQKTLTVGNVGNMPLVFTASIDYLIPNAPPQKDIPVNNIAPQGIELSKTSQGTNGGNPKADNTENPVILNYDGPNADAIGLTSGGTFYAAARFPTAMVAPYAYYTLNTVDVYTNDVPSNATLRIYGTGTATTPGALLHQQVFVPVEDNWNTITLTTPVTLTGTDIWIGYSVTHAAGQYVVGVDAGPANPDGAWISTNGTSWSRLYELAPTLNYNWNIRGTIYPGAIPWLSVNPMGGTVAGGGTLPLTVGFNAASLTVGTYNANIVINSNDPNNPVKNVPVTLTVSGTPPVAQIEVTPAQLSKTMLPNTTETAELIVKSTGTAALTYTVSLDGAAALNEGFEGATYPPQGWLKLNPVAGSGWTTIDAGTTPIPGWQGGTADPAPDGGQKMAFCTWNTGGATSNDQWLVSKQLTMAPGLKLSFHLRYWPNTFADRVQVKISTTVQNNVNAFTIMVADLIFGTTSPDTWQLYTYNLDQFLTPGTNFYIGFREFVADNTNDGAAIFLDNVKVAPESSWIGIAPLQGTLAPGAQNAHTVTFNTAGLAVGNYTGSIKIASNAQANPLVTVPVTLSVVNTIVTPGDSNCDGVVNVLDVVTTISYILFGNPQPFCFENADINGDGNINVLDVVGTISIILGTKSTEVPGISSSSAHIYMNQNSIELQSDGTLAGLQFDITGMKMNQMTLALEGYEFIGAVKDGIFRGIVFSYDNTPLPAGKITLFNIKPNSSLSWGGVTAANVNADQVEVLKFQGQNAVENQFVLNVFPNPAKEFLTIQSNQTIELIRMTNQLGQIVEERLPQVENAMINTSSLRRGIYILEVHTQQNVSIQKIVIE